VTNNRISGLDSSTELPSYVHELTDAHVGADVTGGDRCGRARINSSVWNYKADRANEGNNELTSGNILELTGEEKGLIVFETEDQVEVAAGKKLVVPVDQKSIEYAEWTTPSPAHVNLTRTTAGADADLIILIANPLTNTEAGLAARIVPPPVNESITDSGFEYPEVDGTQYHDEIGTSVVSSGGTLSMYNDVPSFDDGGDQNDLRHDAHTEIDAIIDAAFLNTSTHLDLDPETPGEEVEGPFTIVGFLFKDGSKWNGTVEFDRLDIPNRFFNWERTIVTGARLDFANWIEDA